MEPSRFASECWTSGMTLDNRSPADRERREYTCPRCGKILRLRVDASGVTAMRPTVPRHKPKEPTK